ncbi:MAG: DegT/DnrJ/EryC1/StrS family aminotransferase, partial [Actinomycetota bacterium]|nr:DegT/DnrJ/EryC1/StrS family aminotransferase [Actinomycetota bacterium]
MTDIPLVDLSMGTDEVQQILPRLERVLRRGWFVLGPEVRAFEEELAQSAGRAHAIGVGSGTDALILVLRALGIGAGDEVVVPDFTAFPTVAAVIEAGATPVLVDVEATRPLLDLAATLQAVTPRTRAVILVHLYGICADATRFARALGPLGVTLIEDCAQAQGATLPSGAPVGSAGQAATFSFYPTKNLGAVGDAGAVVTDEIALADEIRALRSHGERGIRYRHEIAARNSRLDDIQAVVLGYRMRSLSSVVERRRVVSELYDRKLPVGMYVSHGPGDAPHLAVALSDRRDELSTYLNTLGIATGCHYPLPVSAQPAMAGGAERPAAHPTPNASSWAARC